MLRSIVVWMLAAAAWAASPVMAQSAYPAKPVTFVVPYPPGGPADLIARIVAGKFAAMLPQPVLVENRSGASGNIGTEYVARAPADGYTLLFGSSPALVINPSLYRKQTFDPLKDLEPVAHFGSLPNAVLVHRDLGIDSIGALVEHLKTQPGTYASAGSGGTTHLAGLAFGKAAGIKLVHVPHRGTAPALQALLGQHVTMTFTDVMTAAPHVKSGTLRMLAVTSAEPSRLFPKVPTLRSIGMQEVDNSVFFALLAPRGLPQTVTAVLARAAREAVEDPAIRDRLQAQGLDLPAEASARYLDQVMRTETPRWRKLIAETGATVD